VTGRTVAAHSVSAVILVSVTMAEDNYNETKAISDDENTTYSHQSIGQFVNGLNSAILSFKSLKMIMH